MVGLQVRFSGGKDWAVVIAALVGEVVPEADQDDVGTGSGAVALALKSERPDLEVVATDASADALKVARANALLLGLDVAFAHGDLLAPVSGRVDAVLSNPPYVEDGAPLAPEIARYEPPGALFAGPDGLAVYRRLGFTEKARDVLYATQD